MNVVTFIVDSFSDYMKMRKNNQNLDEYMTRFILSHNLFSPNKIILF